MIHNNNDNDALTNNTIALKRNAYIEMLNEAYAENYGNWLENQTSEKRERIQRKARWLKHGLATIAPVTCYGPKRCPFFHACPIPIHPTQPGVDADYPMHMPCVLEVEYTSQQVVSYMEVLKVDPNDPVEMSLINELALLDLWKNRAVMIMSGGDSKGQGRDLLTADEIITGWSDDGTARTVIQMKEHPAIGIMEKHERRRTKVLDKFAATRESKFKLYGGNLETNSKLFADITYLRGWVEQNLTRGISLNPEDIDEEHEKTVTLLLGQIDENI